MAMNDPSDCDAAISSVFIRLEPGTMPSLGPDKVTPAIFGASSLIEKH